MSEVMLRGLAIAVLAGGVAFAAGARADCEADCSAQYEKAMTACQTANADSVALQSCMDQAQAAYGSCAEQCTGGQNDQED